MRIWTTVCMQLGAILIIVEGKDLPAGSWGRLGCVLVAGALLALAIPEKRERHSPTPIRPSRIEPVRPWPRRWRR